MTERAVEELDVAGRKVTVDTRLLAEGARAVYVAHRKDGEWFFAAPDFLERPGERKEGVPLKRLVAADPSLAEVCDLKPGWHAFRTTPGDSWWSTEIPHGQMYLLSYEARPTELVEDRDGIGGAFVNCWVVSESMETAGVQAREHLEDTGWAIVRSISEQTFDENDVGEEGEEYFRQAEIDGEVYVIHAFPPEKADA